jgi:sulfide:quinone oxidoreductase
VAEFASPLSRVVERYTIDGRFGHELVEVRPSAREAVFKTRDGPTTTVAYDLLHAVPPQSALGFLKSGPLAVPDDPRGWVDVDGETLQHRRYPDVFALGDCSGAPNARTGAAVRKHAPVVVDNLLGELTDRSLRRATTGTRRAPSSLGTEMWSWPSLTTRVGVTRRSRSSTQRANAAACGS